MCYALHTMRMPACLTAFRLLLKPTGTAASNIKFVELKFFEQKFFEQKFFEQKFFEQKFFELHVHRSLTAGVFHFVENTLQFHTVSTKQRETVLYN